MAVFCTFMVKSTPNMNPICQVPVMILCIVDPAQYGVTSEREAVQTCKKRIKTWH